MKKNNIFLDVHAIQTLPPSNVNRDDTGSPKTAQYGGVRRARVSSQSWKRAMRQYFYENSTQANVGVRTLNIVEFVADKIISLDSSIDKDKAMDLADKVINDGGVKTKDKKAKALFFLGDSQATELAKLAIDGKADKSAIQDVIKNNPAIDIALFGRMVADDPSLNEDASSQVANAISTHAIQSEFDFFTAIDDLAPKDNAGAGMLGTVEFNSSTLYRYANISLHELSRQLGDIKSVVNTSKLFVEAFAKSLPTGKANTFANQTLPQLLLVNIRGDRPVNLVSAFEKPVVSNNGYVYESEVRLIKEMESVEKFVNKPIVSFLVSADDINIDDSSIFIEKSLNDLLQNLEERLLPLLEINIGD